MNSKCLILFNLLIAVIFGIFGGLVYITGGIINISANIWLGLGIAIAVLVLLILLVTTWIAAVKHEDILKECLYKYGGFLLVTTLASIVLAMIALFVGVTILTIGHAILIGLFSGFFAAMILFLIDLFVCVYKHFCPRCEC